MVHVVYLDTSDFARLANRDRDNELNNIFEYLKSKVQHHKISIPISYYIFWELIQDFSSEHREDRLRRISVIEDLCDGFCVSFPSDIGKFGVFPQDGIWMPREWFNRTLSHDGLLREYLKILRNDAGLNRLQYRWFKKPKQRADFFKNHPSDLSSLLLKGGGLPISQEYVDQNVWQKFLEGEISGAIADSHFSGFLRHPKNFFKFWFECLDSSNPVAGLSQVKEMFVKNIGESRELQSDVDEMKEYLAVRRKLNRRSNSMAWNEKREHRTETKVMQGQLQDAYEKIFNPNRLSGCRGACDVYNAFSRKLNMWYFEDTSKNSRKILDSEFIDLFHASYIPFVSLWRGDKAFATALKNSNLGIDRKVISKLIDLPASIDDLLSADEGN